MSANLDLSFEIHDYDESKRAELRAAADAFLAGEGFAFPEMIVECLGEEGYVCGYTTGPVIISNAHRWVPEVTERWKAMAERVNGAPCRAIVKVTSPDDP